MNSLLTAAEDTRSSLDTSLENANMVKKDLAAINAGELLVQPPISHDQHSAYLHQASVIGSLAQKGIDALKETTRARQTVEETSSSSPGAGASFSGAGSEGKS